jgi:HNH endonuclease
VEAPAVVTIRTLKPIVKLRIPRATTNLNRPSRVKVVRRTQATHPSPTPQPTPCRLWQGTQGSDGYGWRKINLADGSRKPISMHRWVMQEYLGRKLRPSEVVLHACDNPLCYRFDHLSIGTVQSNNADMRAKGRDVKPPVNVFHGECHPMAKLTAHQVRAIRGHRQSGLSVKTIAEMFEISPSTVRRICKGQTWAYFGNGYGAGPAYVKPPTRDLLAEARAKIAADTPSAPEPAEPPKRIRPVKPIRKGP